MDYYNKPHKIHYFLVFVIGVLIYSGTFNHKFAWDDTLVIEGNAVTQKGIKGIKEIWTSASYIRERPIYRPIPQTIFALQWEFAKNNTAVYHITNTLLYGLACVLLLILLFRLFSSYPAWISIFITLLFALHPVHTEVVSNIKSLDELLSFSSAILALILYYDYLSNRKFQYLIMAMVAIGFSLLCKIGSVSVLGIMVLMYFLQEGRLKDYWNSLLGSVSSFFSVDKLSISHIIFVVINVVAIYLMYQVSAIYLGFVFGVLYLVMFGFANGRPLRLSLILLLAIVSYLFGFTPLTGLCVGLLLWEAVQLKHHFRYLLVLAAYVLAIQDELQLMDVSSFVFIAVIIGFSYWAGIRKYVKIVAALTLFGFVMMVLDIRSSALFFAQGVLLYGLVKDKLPNYSSSLLFLAASVICFFVVVNKNSFSIESSWLTTVEQRLTHKNEVDTDNFYQIHNVLAGVKEKDIKSATIAVIQLKYLQLLVYPYPLVHQYGGNQIGLVHFNNWKVWLSIVIHILLLGFAIYGIRRRWPEAIGVVWYLLTIALYSNILRLMPDTLAERFLFLPSVGFCIFIVFGLYRIAQKISERRVFVVVLLALLPIMGVFAWRTVDRSIAWKDNSTLAQATIANAPNNAAINAQYAAEIRKATANESDAKVVAENNALITKHFKKSLSINPNFYSANSDLGVHLLEMGQPDSSMKYLKKAEALRPNAWINHYYLGFIYYNSKEHPKAITHFSTALGQEISSITDEEFIMASEFLARSYFSSDQINFAINGLTKTYQLFGSKSTYILLGNMYRQVGMIDEAISTFRFLQEDFPEDPDIATTIRLLEEER